VLVGNIGLDPVITSRLLIVTIEDGLKLKQFGNSLRKYSVSQFR
jgi:hypothetical protein